MSRINEELDRMEPLENAQITRIKRMEEILDSVSQVVCELEQVLEGSECPERIAFAGEVFREAERDLKILTEYYEGPLWREDFEADEAGKIPQNIKRGVLSEDAVYHLLADVQRICGQYPLQKERKYMNFNEEALKLHAEHKGKIEVISKVQVKTRDDLSTAYTPGVAEPCRKIHENKNDVYKYTAKGNLVAVVSDGTAVLGLGNIGPEAAMPVMEGKAILFKEFGDVDAFPICLDTQDADEIVKAVKMIAPCFGGINLEDIASPKCFEVEARLEKELDIPVFHDDQHGTAVVVTAALLNALKVVGKNMEDIHVVLNGPGSAGTAIIKMLLATGVKHIIACDENGILYKDRGVGMKDHKAMLCEITNLEDKRGTLADAIVGADVFIGVSVGGALKPEMIKTMAQDPIVFAMANPTPEIMYEEAMAAGVKVMGTGRSDYPNQINNVLAFPGIFRGALDCGARDINYEMKVAAAHAIAELVTEEKLSADYIIPGALEPGVAQHVAMRVAEAAVKSGAIRK